MKIILIVTALVLFNFVAIYGQGIFNLDRLDEIDVLAGPVGATPIFSDDYPQQRGSDIPLPNKSADFTTFSGFVSVFNISANPGVQLTEFEAPSPPITDQITFAFLDRPILYSGRSNGQLFSNISGPTRVFARGNNNDVRVGIFDADICVVKDEAVVNSAGGIIGFKDNFDLGYNTPTGQVVRGFGNIDGVPAVILENSSSEEIIINKLTGNPPAFNSTYIEQTQRISPPTSNNYSNSSLTSFSGGYIYYKADDGVNGQELWTSDGTIAGTYMVKNIHATSHSFPYDLTPMNNLLYFVAATQNENSELWVSDGSELGTTMVKDINPTFGHSNIGRMININNMLYFKATNGINGTELWKSDGSSNGTVMIKDINQSISGASSSPYGFTLFNDLIYFGANDGINGTELWVTDGTAIGTHLVKNINNIGDGSIGSNPILPGLPNGNVFYFYADDGRYGKELWVTDGTREGTHIVFDLNPGPNDSNIYGGWGKIAGGSLFFGADNGIIGYELFVFDNAPSSVPMARCSLKVFLEGSYVSNSMSTNLTTSIPLGQPFNNTEGNYYGDESISSTFAATHNIVDWVKVELRTGTSAATATTIVASKAVLVNSDGNLVDLDGSLDIDFKWVTPGNNYYVAVYHRNHLAVLSSGFVPF